MRQGLIITFPGRLLRRVDRVKGFKKAAPNLDGDPGARCRLYGAGRLQDGSADHSCAQDEITWVYTENDSLAEGVIQALKKTGCIPARMFWWSAAPVTATRPTC